MSIRCVLGYLLFLFSPVLPDKIIPIPSWFNLGLMFTGLRRCGKSCRLRWTNYLRPDIKRGAFSSEEEETILNLHSLHGNK